MQLNFHKYQGAGNDFIICDDRQGLLRARMTPELVRRLCDRHFGIGADGLMLLTDAPPPHAFEMIYFNADGSTNTLCGNGARCIVRFASDAGLVSDARVSFLATDGPHKAKLMADGRVALSMYEVADVAAYGRDLVVHTGSPHYLCFVEGLKGLDVVARGREIRYAEPFREEGINVNFVVVDGDDLVIATYERGVEDETLACGTGVTAAAIAHLHREGAADGPFEIAVRARGGDLAVRGRRQGGRYADLWLIGPAEVVFSGHIEI